MDNSTSPVPNGTMLTVARLIDSFLAHVRVMVRAGQTEPATLDWYRGGLVKLAAAAGTFPASELRVHHLIEFEFTNHSTRCLKALFKWAADEDVELVPKNRFLKIKPPRCGRRKRVLTRPEMVRLYRSVTAAFRRFLFVAAHTGARPGELRRLLWRDVHLEGRLILLTEFKAKDRRKDGAEVREIPLDRPTVRMLANMRGRRDPAPDDPVFVSPRTGRPWTKNALVCRMRRARMKAGLDQAGAERVVCYTMRHTMATELTRNGVRDKALARVLGHASTRTTARYQHLDAEDLVRILDESKVRRVG